MDTGERITKLLAAQPATLEAVDAALEGRTSAPQSLKLLTFKEVGKVTGLSRTTVWRATRSGDIKTVEVRPGLFRVPQAEIERLVARRAQP